MNRFHCYALYFAVNSDINEIKRLRNNAFKEFELVKFNKHFSTGKTTIHRKGKKEKQYSFHKERTRKIKWIMTYRKIIKINPDVLQIIEDLKVKISLEEWLNEN